MTTLTPLIIYQTKDGTIKIQTHFENETAWLNINQMAELFQKSRSTILAQLLMSILLIFTKNKNLKKTLQ